MKNRRIISNIVFIVVILLLAIASFISYGRIARLNEASNLVVHANQVKLELAQTSSIIKEAESHGQDSVYLHTTAFNILILQDSADAFENLGALDSLTRDNPVQQKRILQLKFILNRWLHNIHQENARAARLSADISPYARQSQGYARRIDSLIIEMTHMEDDLLSKRIQEKDRSAFLTPLYSLLFSFLAILVVTIAYFGFRNETRLRMQAEEAQSIIRNFFYQAPAMLAILKGPEHTFEFVNPPFRELVGNRHLVGMKIREVIPEAGGQGYFEILDEVYKTREPFTGREMSLQVERGKGLEDIYIDIVFQVLKSSTGRPDGILVFCNEVTEQVLSRNRLRQAENRSRLAIEAARMGTFDWDLQNQNFISSERLVEIFGYQNAASIKHQDLLDRFHPDDKSIRDEAVKISLNLGSLKYEVRIVWPDKSIHWINVFGKIFTDDDKNILRMYGTVVDVTPQKIALEEISESESKFRLLANAMPQMIWTSDKQGNLNYFNQAVYVFTGLDYAEIVKRDWISVVHPDERLENAKKWSTSIKTGNEFNFEHRLRNASGEYRWQLSRAIPQKDQEGNIQMWIGTSTDIQDQKHFVQDLERKVFDRTQSLNYSNLALKQTVNELEQTNAELASFNYIASHDLQEPLRKIIAFSKRIVEIEQQLLSENARDYFNRIIQAASRMQNLIDAFLSYSQNSNIRSSLEILDLNQIFADVKNDYAEIIEQKNIQLDSVGLPRIMGIPLQIQQLFTNLIGNAIKYGRTGIDQKIEFSSAQISGMGLFEGAAMDQPYWKITITDNGIGFDHIYENQIFEPFQRLHSRQEYAGTGIGLAICKKIMRNHQGFIVASGHIGSGASFSMYFPVLIETRSL
jgi:PAS domain S-box-containing protein